MPWKFWLRKQSASNLLPFRNRPSRSGAPNALMSSLCIRANGSWTSTCRAIRKRTQCKAFRDRQGGSPTTLGNNQTFDFDYPYQIRTFGLATYMASKSWTMISVTLNLHRISYPSETSISWCDVGTNSGVDMCSATWYQLTFLAKISYECWRGRNIWGAGVLKQAHSIANWGWLPAIEEVHDLLVFDASLEQD